MAKTKRAQSVVEYLLILAGIIAAILVIKGQLESKVASSYNGLTENMASAIGKIDIGE